MKPVSEIKALDFSDSPELQAMQEQAINLAQNKTDHMLRAYNGHPDTMGGRYVCSDTFKELFPAFERIEQRALATSAVHNSSAVLAATQFEAVLQRDEPTRNHAVFVTGIPGSGKTTTVTKLMMDDRVKVMFEGQLANPQPAMPKIEQCLKQGLKVTVVAVHLNSEQALDNTFKRFNEYGRGASVQVMSHIQGQLPSGLKAIREAFGDRVKIIAVDRNRDNQVIKDFSEIEKTLNVGTQVEILTRLKTKLDQDFEAGKISAACYHQANSSHITQHKRELEQVKEALQAENKGKEITLKTETKAAIPYRGEVVMKTAQFVIQKVASHVFQAHKLSAFEKAPDVGENLSISYSAKKEQAIVHSIKQGLKR